MSNVAVATSFANHPLSMISKYASHCKSNGGFIIEPPLLENLYGLVHIEYESKTSEDILPLEHEPDIDVDMTLEDSITPPNKDGISVVNESNQRFYVDETNMIERRFLADDTSKFKEKRDIDPFSSAVLHDNILDSLWETLNLEKDIKSVTQEIFLNNIKNTDQTNEQSMILQIARTEWRRHSVESVRASCRWEWGTGLEESHAMTLLWETMRSGSGSRRTHDTIGVVGIIWDLPILLEKRSSNNWIEFGARPGNDNRETIWIREVPDGFLGIRTTSSVVREYTRRLKMTGQVYSSDTFIRKEKLCYKVPTVSEIQEILAKNSIEYSKKDKKPELTRRLEENLLWEIY
jgi:hypothetical protein